MDEPYAVGGTTVKCLDGQFVECVCYLLVCGGCFVADGDSVVVSLARFFLFPSPCIVSSLQCVRACVCEIHNKQKEQSSRQNHKQT